MLMLLGIARFDVKLSEISHRMTYERVRDFVDMMCGCLLCVNVIVTLKNVAHAFVLT